MPERVTVDDDALISTDVDKLIKTISSKGTIELGELERATQIGRKNMDKWIHVLEEEGYIRVEYRLTKTYVTWEGDSAPEEIEAREEVEEPERASPFKEFTLEPEKSPFKSEEEEEHRKKKKVLEDLNEEGAMGEEPTAVELVEAEDRPSEAKARAKRKPDDEVKAPDLTFDELRTDLEKEVEKDIEEIGKEELSVEEPEFQVGEEVQKEILAKPEPKRKDKMVPLKEKVDAYLGDINNLRKEVERLKKEKENLYRDRYLKLESKVESDIVSITERILEKEGRIIDLKEKVLELPDKVEEADKLQRVVEKIGKEGRSALETAKGKVATLLEATESAEEEISSRMANIQKELDKGRKRLVELQDGVSSITHDESKLRTMLGDFQKQMDSLNDRMQSTVNSLEESAELKIEISDMTDQLRVSLERRERQLADLDRELEEIKKVENWVKEYVTDYENKIEEIESYVSHSDEEMDELREAAEKSYISKYLKELESVTKLYENELEGISMDEKELDHQITDAKSRLTSLINESQQMLRTLYKEGDSGERFGSAMRERREKTAHVRDLVEEKEREKERLSEDISRAKDKRRSVPSKPSKESEKDHKSKKNGKK